MSHLEKLEELLDAMGVWYEREDNDGGTILTIPGGPVEGYKNRGYEGVEVNFDKHGNCHAFYAG